MQVSHKYRLASVLLAICFPAGGQEAPRLGLLYNKTEALSLSYDCESPRAGAMVCRFVHTAVRPKASYSDLSAVLERARKHFHQGGKTFSVADCKLQQNLLDVLEGRAKAPKAEALEALSVVARRDALALSRALVAHCEKQDEATFLAMVRVGQDRDRRTCIVRTSSYTRTFRFASESRSNTEVWIAQSAPEGICGIVWLSRFESEQITLGDSTFKNWRYIARKAITNPTAEVSPGLSCGKLDEQPYAYDWRSKEHQLSCDYIEFSPF